MFSKELMATLNLLPMLKKNTSSIRALREKFMKKVPEILAMQTMKQTLCKITKSRKP
mgnify:CR=1 FL=1